MEYESIYDNPVFFEGYRQIRAQKNNYNDLLEQPVMRALLPDLSGKTVLDLGCGYGRSCADAVARGACRVVGIDLSERMLEVARRENADPKIVCRRMDISRAGGLGERFDLVYSSLAFHYIPDFAALVRVLAGLVRPGGTLLFSQEHPVVTAPRSDRPSWVRDAGGNPEAFLLSDYNRPGRRESHWIIDGVVVWHRTMGEIVTALAQGGFRIDILRETSPSEAALAADPSLCRELHKPNFLIIRAERMPDRGMA